MSCSNHHCSQPSCSSVLPHGEDVYVSGKECDIKVDISVDQVRSIVIWGHVIDCRRCPVPNALVNLMRYTDRCSGKLEEVCHTYTDQNGFYQFDLRDGCTGYYRILITKSVCEPKCPPQPPCHCCQPQPCPPCQSCQPCHPPQPCQQYQPCNQYDPCQQYPSQQHYCQNPYENQCCSDSYYGSNQYYKAESCKTVAFNNIRYQ